MNRKEAFAEIRKRGGSKAIVEFSGGNDDGGVNDIKIVSQTGFPVCSIEPWDDPDPTSKKLAETLSAPVYDRYYSFAGEFYVNGTVIWDADKETVVMTGSQSREEWDDFEEQY